MTAISIQNVLGSRDCAQPSCAREAENGSDYCRVCQALTEQAATAATNGGNMTATVATAVCKIDGCELPVADNVGMYAKLCMSHKQDARAARAAAPTVPRPTRTGGASSLSDRARALVPLARAVDRARARLADLPSIDTARAAFAEASRIAQVSPTGANLDQVVDATKRLQTFAPKRTRAEADVAQAERDLEVSLRAFVAEVRKA